MADLAPWIVAALALVGFVINSCLCIMLHNDLRESKRRLKEMEDHE